MAKVTLNVVSCPDCPFFWQDGEMRVSHCNAKENHPSFYFATWNPSSFPGCDKVPDWCPLRTSTIEVKRG